MTSIIERIQSFNADREPERLALKYQRMRANAFAFFRGTCHLFYEDWVKGGPLDAAPLAWLSGDLHLENFGSYKGDNRLGYFDLNDFDEAFLAPASWDLARFTTSLYLAADALKIGDSDTRALAATMASSTALDPVVSVALGLALLDEHIHASGLQAAGAFVALAAALLGVAVLARAEVPDVAPTS